VRIVAIDHVQLALPAGGEDEARRFYSGLLGIPEVAKPAPLARRGGAWFEDGAVRIHLGVDPDFRAARKAHPALRVRGLAALVERLRAAGVEVIPDDELPDHDRVYVRDPFGNRLELLEARPAPGEIVLREVAESDLPLFFEHQRDPLAFEMAAVAPRDGPAFDAHWATVLADERNLVRTILFRGRVAGNVVSFDRLGEREVGYWIGREYWGQGIATRALAAFLEIERTRPLHARVARHHDASRRVLEKCGFVVTQGEPSGLPDARGEAVEEIVLWLPADGAA
jgi:RimJ/RimL family protein N-acetyltransferase/catechol 2,3-dioxygenase-like lactoylglutathione lyase family enzyme